MLHHTEFLKQLIEEGRLTLNGGTFKGKRITYHDPCYLGRANEIYEAPRALIEKLDAELVEMRRCKKDALCCGAGGAQMFKEPEKGNKDINIARSEEVLETQTDLVVAACLFCSTMLNDGMTQKGAAVSVKDIAQLIAEVKDL